MPQPAEDTARAAARTFLDGLGRHATHPGRLLSEVLDVLDAVQDILAERVQSPLPPPWCEVRGWSDFLLGLDDSELEIAERVALGVVTSARRDAPPDLVTLIARVATLTRVETASAPTQPPDLRRASPRKEAQVEALAELARRHLPAPGRVVDVGAGHGHLTRALATALGAEAIGLDRDANRVATARALSNGGVTFERWDGAIAPLALRRGDLAVGLHACGDLGDLIVTRAAATGADALLVSCCLQKIADDVREPLSNVGRARRFVARRPLLGLANLCARESGVEDPMHRIMESRETRYALRSLLRSRGAECAPGEESRGINRRRMRHGLASVATMALAARGLPPATEDELIAVATRARADFAVIRRLDLPRVLLARLLELAVVLDRAAALADAGHGARVIAAFSTAESPRNLAIVARAPR